MCMHLNMGASLSAIRVDILARPDLTPWMFFPLKLADARMCKALGSTWLTFWLQGAMYFS